MIGSRAWFLCVIALLAWAGATASSAQDSAQPARPRIGLALGGGSARGFAHIGVLEWLEEHHIPVDYVVGTSMGGLMGGIYATGMPPHEIRALVNGINWDEIFLAEAPFALKEFRRKEDERSYPARLELGLKHGVRLQGGLDPGEPVLLLIDRLILPYSASVSFDDLPIPFRCVAVDMVRAEQVILKDGPLSTALRATMSLPAIFNPVERDGRILADGGLLNNVPADVARAMGADIVIAVDVGAEVPDEAALQNLSEVLNRSIAVMIEENTRRTVKFADLVVTPELAGVDSLDWEKKNYCADQGYKAAEAKARFLQTLSVDEETWQRYLAERERRRRSHVAVPRFLRVEGASPQAREAIEARLTRYVGQPLDTARLATDLTEITGTGRYDTAGYQLIREGERDGLLVTVHEKSYGPPFMRVVTQINGAQTDNIQFNLGTRITFLDVGTPGAEVRTDLGIGSHTILASEYYRPITPSGRFFVAPRLFYQRENQDLYQRGLRVAEYRVRQTGGSLDVGRALSRNSELRLGYEVSRLNASVRVGDPVLPRLDGTVSAARLLWAYEGQDQPRVPTRGLRAATALRWYFAAPGTSEGFPNAELQLSWFRPLGKRGTGFLLGSGGTSFGHVAPPAQQFTIGGPLTLGAYGLNEFRGSNYILAQVGYLYRIARLPTFLGGNAYLGGLLQHGSAFEDLDSADFHTDLASGFYVDTILGPAFFGGSVGEGGRSRLYFTIGQLF
jgi:NTE family protein